jgi:hypothetical protein
MAARSGCRSMSSRSFWTGEWVRDISCHMVPLGNGPHGKDAFIEIQCYVDAHAPPAIVATTSASPSRFTMDMYSPAPSLQHG